MRPGRATSMGRDVACGDAEQRQGCRQTGTVAGAGPTDLAFVWPSVVAASRLHRTHRSCQRGRAGRIGWRTARMMQGDENESGESATDDAHSGARGGSSGPTKVPRQAPEASTTTAAGGGSGKSAAEGDNGKKHRGVLDEERLQRLKKDSAEMRQQQMEIIGGKLLQLADRAGQPAMRLGADSRTRVEQWLRRYRESSAPADANMRRVADTAKQLGDRVWHYWDARLIPQVVRPRLPTALRERSNEAIAGGLHAAFLVLFFVLPGLFGGGGGGAPGTERAAVQNRQMEQEAARLERRLRETRRPTAVAPQAEKAAPTTGATGSKVFPPEQIPSTTKGTPPSSLEAAKPPPPPPPPAAAPSASPPAARP
eukprot:ctg_3764.g404